MRKPVLRVVSGGSQQLPEWADFRPVVYARHPFDATKQVQFRVALQDVLKAARAQLRNPAFQLWSVVYGRPPPVNNVEWSGNQPYREGLTRLEEAHACFKGVNRPFAEDDYGDTVVAYVVKPTAFYKFEPHMVTMAHRRAVPDDVVFIAYVKLDQPCDPGSGQVRGCLTHWAFVEADPENKLLPADFETRFGERLW